MRIHTLAVAGFGPYLAEQVVDFDAYLDDGLYLITGKTGAGKSSILDAICYALYNSVPRYDGTEARLRSDHCAPDDPTLVTLEFSVGSTRYRVERSPEYERPKRRGTGTTKAKAEARLFVRRDDDWVGIAARPVDVGNELDRILHLKKEQFLQVILLAQNRFQEFLLAKNDDRQAVLRALFGTRRFQSYERSLDDRRKALEADVDAARRDLDLRLEQARRLVATDPSTDAAVEEIEPGHPLSSDDLDAALATVGSQISAAKAALELAETQLRAADAEERRLRSVRERQERRARARADLVRLTAEIPAIDACRRELDAATRASSMSVFIDQRDAAAASAEISAVQVASARIVYERFDAPAGDLDALVDEIDALTTALGTLVEPLETEQGLEKLARTELDATTRASELGQRLVALTERGVALPAELEALQASLETARSVAATLDSARAEHERLGSALVAAREAVRLEQRLVDAQADELAASLTRTTASQALDALLTHRLQGHAAELASELSDGDACQVCGSTEHPQRATWDGEPVTEALVKESRAALDGAAEAAESATRVAADIATARAEALGRAEGRSVTELDGAVAVAKRAVTAATEAASRADLLDAERTQIRDELEELDRRRTKLREEADLAKREVVEARSHRTSAEELVARYRDGFATIFDRAESLESRRTAASALAEAHRSAATSDATLRGAEQTLADQLATHGFPDVEGATVVRRSSSDREALDERIRAHEQSLAKANGVLDEPELADLPGELVNIESAAEALLGASDARDAAFRIAEHQGRRHTELGVVVGQVRDAEAAHSDMIEHFEVLRRLAATVRGETPNTRKMRLESYVLAAELEEIVTAANTRLRTMSGNRYLLEHSDAVAYRRAQSGLGLSILDQFTGLTRPTNSLSGGETFLASLALALGLAEVVTNRAGGITLDTLFIDEGFGSLDAETLAIAMGTLDSLRSGGRTVGVISHVEAMKEQIAAKLSISVSKHGWSEVQRDAA